MYYKILSFILMSSLTFCKGTAPNKPFPPYLPKNVTISNQIVSLTESTLAETKVFQKKNVVIHRLESEVNKDSVSETIDKLSYAVHIHADYFMLIINSPGGNVGSGWKLVEAIESSPVNTVCVVSGEAASMAAIITESCSVRAITLQGNMMWHEPTLGLMEMSGQPNEWESTLKMLKAMRDGLAEYVSYHFKNITVEEYNRRTSGGLMWWMSSKEALKYGAVDLIVPSIKSLFIMLQDSV